jgi:hypothetical protein
MELGRRVGTGEEYMYIEHLLMLFCLENAQRHSEAIGKWLFIASCLAQGDW